MPPSYSNVPYRVRPAPPFGTKPTRAVLHGVKLIMQLPVWIGANAAWFAQLFLAGLQVCLGWLVSGAWKAVEGLGGAISGAAGWVYEAAAARMQTTAPGVEVVVEEVVDVMRAPPLGSDEVVF